jgi:PAS domain S-box-containing protein
MTQQALRVLLLEDSESDADVLSLELRRAGYAPATTRVESREAFAQALGAGPWDLLIADYNLPSFSGLDALAIYKESGVDVPFFLVSGTVGEEIAVAAMRTGAHDYLLKDNLTRLGPAVARELREADLRRNRRDDLSRLVASERRFTTIFRSSPVAIVVATLESGQIYDINSAALELFGRTREEVVGRPASEFGAWPDSVERRAISGDAISQERSGSFEREVPSRSNGPLTVLASFSVIELDGQARLVVTLQDITARKLAEQTLRTSEERFRLLVENSNELIVELTRDGTILYASPNHAQITGRDPTELVGSRALDFVHPDDLVEAAAKLSEREGTGLFRYRFQDGSFHWLEVSGRTFRLANSEERGVLVSRDVSPRIAADEARKELEGQLRQAQKLDALGTLAGGIAHDFNNILAAISAYSELAELDAEQPEAVRSHLSEVLNATTRATELVRRILAFSRQHKQARVPVQLEQVIADALKLVRSTLPATIEIVSAITDGPHAVLADPIQVHQVVMNLCTNAAHAMAERTGRLTIELASVNVDAALTEVQRDLRVGRYVRLSVTDSGSGMDEATVSRIFEPFFTTKAPGEGTGLGLAVVHGIVRDHDGAIAVRSQPGLGTTFEIHFPESAERVTTPAGAVAEVLRGRGERVLFVDDEPALCRSAHSMLERLGYRVTATSDPEDALGRFRDGPQQVDLVITDLTMPRMTGIDLARELLAVRPDLPIVMVSGFSGKWTPDKAREIGIRASLNKPLTLSSLAGALRAVLEDKPRPHPETGSE